MMYITLLIIGVVLALSLYVYLLITYKNQIIVVGRLYSILRDNGVKRTKHVSVGFMRGTNPPWYTGKGLQLRIGVHVLQIGFCKKNADKKNDVEGTLFAVQGRYLDDSAHDIGSW